jgi:transposase-like protein
MQWPRCKNGQQCIFADKNNPAPKLTNCAGRYFQRPLFQPADHALCGHWRLRFQPSFRDLVDIMAGRGISPAHMTTARWIQRYAQRRWNRVAGPTGRSRRVDDYEIKVRWTCHCPAVDKERKAIDFLLRTRRDVAAAKHLFRRTFRRQRRLSDAPLQAISARALSSHTK